MTIISMPTVAHIYSNHNELHQANLNLLNLLYYIYIYIHFTHSTIITEAEEEKNYNCFSFIPLSNLSELTTTRTRNYDNTWNQFLHITYIYRIRANHKHIYYYTCDFKGLSHNIECERCHTEGQHKNTMKLHSFKRWRWNVRRKWNTEHLTWNVIHTIYIHNYIDVNILYTVIFICRQCLHAKYTYCQTLSVFSNVCVGYIGTNIHFLFQFGSYKKCVVLLLIQTF